MSKIYKRYIELKSSPNYKEDTLFLFKSGLFFIFIDKDAKIVSNFLNLKLGLLNNSIVKCGFPINSLEKYLNLLKPTPYHIEIVNLSNNTTAQPTQYLQNENIKSIVDEILSINIDQLSISQVYDFLYKIQNQLSELNKESIFNETKE